MCEWPKSLWISGGTSKKRTGVSWKTFQNGILCNKNAELQQIRIVFRKAAVKTSTAKFFYRGRWQFNVSFPTAVECFMLPLSWPTPSKEEFFIVSLDSRYRTLNEDHCAFRFFRAQSIKLVSGFGATEIILIGTEILWKLMWGFCFDLHSLESVKSSNKFK